MQTHCIHSSETCTEAASPLASKWWKQGCLDVLSFHWENNSLQPKLGTSLLVNGHSTMIKEIFISMNLILLSGTRIPKHS
uniref:Uncharacterized protein n=1 Tax=Manihot esculenta TaxID=3983 RepID=A0A2C9U0N1_MANES